MYRTCVRWDDDVFCLAIHSHIASRVAGWLTHGRRFESPGSHGRRHDRAIFSNSAMPRVRCVVSEVEGGRPFRLRFGNGLTAGCARICEVDCSVDAR
jgi:hypothetical protein